VTIGGCFLALAAVAVSFVRDVGGSEARTREALPDTAERAVMVPESARPVGG